MNSNAIDWNTVSDITPLLFSWLCWLVWLAFLLIPTVTGSHGTNTYSVLENALYVLVGLTFCVTINVMLKVGAGVRGVLFGLVLFVLAYWF